MPNKILLIDPGMFYTGGHHYAYNLAFRDAFDRRGVRARYLFADRVGQDMLAQFPGGEAALSWFMYLAQLHAGNGSPGGVRQSAEHLAADLLQKTAGHVDADTLVFCHSLDLTALWGLSLWHKALPARLRPVMALNVMLGLYASDSCRNILRSIRPDLPGQDKLRLFAGARAATALLADAFALPCTMLPSPLPPGFEAFHRRSGDDEKPLWGVFGDARPGKNLHMLPSLIMRYLAEGGAGDFLVHMMPSDSEVEDALLALHELTVRFPGRVDMHLDHPETSHYYALIGCCSALILPYGADSYHAMRPSGVAIECASLGVPVLSFAGGFIEEELAPLNNGSLFVVEAGSAALVKGALLFDREWRERKNQALDAAPSYYARHGADAILAMLMEGIG